MAISGPIPATYQIHPREVDLLIQDVNLEIDRYNLYYVIDFEELVEYCFPLGATFSHNRDLDEVAADQTALDELFTKRKPRPILAPHYVDELARHFNFIRSSTCNIYDDLEMCQRLMDYAGDPQKLIDQAQLKDVIRLSENITRNIAVWMGIASIGAKRFQQVLSHSLMKLSDVEQGKISALARQYKPRFATEIYSYLKRSLEALDLDETKLNQRLKAAKADAGAIDWLIQLNQRSIELAASGGPRCLFLYLSSAHKNKGIFSSLPLPRFPDKDEPFDFWRTRHQLLLLATARREINQQPNEVIKNLETIRHLAEVIRRARLNRTAVATCNLCILEGKEGDHECPWKEACAELRSVAKTKHDISNLSLLARIQSYRNLIDANPKLADQKTFILGLKELLDRGELPDLALAEIKDKQLFAESKEIVRTYLDSENRDVKPLKSEASLPEPFRFLPYTFPKLHIKKYKDIADLVFQYCELAPSMEKERGELIRHATEQFESIDNSSPSEDHEHELTRLLLTLTFGRNRYPSQVLEESRHFAKSFVNYRFQFLYIAIIAAKELKRYLDVRDLIEEALVISQEPILYFWRSSNIFRWNEDQKMRKFFAPRLDQCIADGRTALESFHHVSLPLELITLNNLCAFHSYADDPPFDSIFDLTEARRLYDELYAKMEKRKDMFYSEFLHTGAHLALREAQLRSAGWEPRLRTAKSLIESAIRMNPKPLYLETKRQIDGLLPSSLRS